MVADDEALFDANPAVRLTAARNLSPRARRRWLGDTSGWPTESPGARNAWLLFVTTKTPSWRDPLHPWPAGPLTLGEPHDGFLYPDPIGFWNEVRRWSLELFRLCQPQWSTAESLSLTALVHVGGDRSHLDTAMRTCAPRTVVFLDEPAWQAADLDVATTPRSVPDPHRPGQFYEGWWGNGGQRVGGGQGAAAPDHASAVRRGRSRRVAPRLPAPARRVRGAD